MKVQTYRGAPARLCARGRAALAIAWTALLLSSTSAQGFGYGQPQVSSALGQVLHLRVPLRLDPDMELSSPCVRLLAGPAGDGIPTLTLARILVERQGERRFLRIDSFYPVNEPALRVVVDAGCGQHAQREFLLLLDPPNLAPQLALNPPTVEAPSASALAGAGRGAEAASAAPPTAAGAPAAQTEPEASAPLAPASVAGAPPAAPAPTAAAPEAHNAPEAPAPAALAPVAAAVPAANATAAPGQAQRPDAASTLRGPLLTPTVPEQTAAVNAQGPRSAGADAASSKPRAATAVATNGQAKAHGTAEGPRAPPRPGGDRLTIAATADAPDPAAQRLAQMDQRILELTREVVQLRADLVAERQRQALAAPPALPTNLPWIIAALAVLALGVALALLARQWRRAGAWQASAWQAGAVSTEPPPVHASAAAQSAAPEASREAPRATGAAFSDAARAPVLAGAKLQRPRPSVAAAPVFDDPATTPSTLTALTDSQQELIEVTEMHADDPGFGAMHTVFLDPGALDEPPVVSSSHATDAGVGQAPLPLPSLADLPPLPDAAAAVPTPKVLASDSGLRASLDEGPFTQTPTLLLLDLDLSTQALRVDDPDETAPDRIAAPAPAQRPAPHGKLA